MQKEILKAIIDKPPFPIRLAENTKPSASRLAENTVTSITTCPTFGWMSNKAKGSVSAEDTMRAQSLVDWLGYFTGLLLRDLILFFLFVFAVRSGTKEGKQQIRYGSELLDTFATYQSLTPPKGVCTYVFTLPLPSPAPHSPPPLF
jgi:hypothetical protein